MQLFELLQQFWIYPLLFALYALYRFFKLFFHKETKTLLYREDGKTRTFGTVKYNAAENSYRARDLTKRYTNQYQGYIQVQSDGNGWLYLINEKTEGTGKKMLTVGYMTPNSIIYDVQNRPIGYLYSHKKSPKNGYRKWYELFLRAHTDVYLFGENCNLQEEIEKRATPNTGITPKGNDRLIGRCIETGRLRKANITEYTSLARGAVFTAFYYKKAVQCQAENYGQKYYNWFDTALISSFIFSFIFALVTLFNIEFVLFPSLGVQLGFAASMLLLYLGIWVLMRQIKIEQLLNGYPIDHFLMLLNRNTGMRNMGNLIILLAITSIVISFTIHGSNLLPLQIVILLGFLINRRHITGADWEIKDHFEDLFFIEETTPSESEGENKKYEWLLDSKTNNLQGVLEIKMKPDHIHRLREINPFNHPENGHLNNAETLFKISHNLPNPYIKKVKEYILKAVSENNLSEPDKMQFILDFVQDNIHKTAKEESIQNFDYVKFPEETLFDRQGNASSKAALAAVLYQYLGYKTVYLMTEHHAALGVAFNTNFHLNKSPEYKIGKDGYLYFFCETADDKWEIGNISIEGVQHIKEILYLN